MAERTLWLPSGVSPFSVSPTDICDEKKEFVNDHKSNRKLKGFIRKGE
jgi:hypothetical protein